MTMALVHCNFFAHSLGLCVSVDAIIPQPEPEELGTAAGRRRAAARRHPTLWLLHGLSDDHTIWQRRTSIERYVEGRGLAVVMPAVGRSFFADMASGPRYWTFISEELPAIARSLLPLSDERADNFAAGLSMGGYGALKLALRHPDRYAAAATLSGAVDLAGEHAKAEPGAWQTELQGIFGNLKKFAGGENDTMALATKLARSRGPKPAIFQCCGTEDFLYQANVRFRDHARKIGLKLTYEEGPGSHEWPYWDRMIQRVIEWLPLKRRGT